MSELKGELRRETERMNAKMGVVEAQMRLVLKLLRRNNKINDIDPEIGMQLNELMQHNGTLEEENEEDLEWFVADSQGWKDEPPTTSSSGRTGSRKSHSTTPHHKVIMSTAKKPEEVKRPISARPNDQEKVIGNMDNVKKGYALDMKPHTVVDMTKKKNKPAALSRQSNRLPSAKESKPNVNEGFEEEKDVETIHL